MKKESTKEKLLNSDDKLLSLQEKLEMKKAERLEAQQKMKVKPSATSLRQTSSMMREKVKYRILQNHFFFEDYNLLGIQLFRMKY